MTTRPQLRLGRHLLPGLIAVALFVLIAYATLRTEFGDAAGFPADESITANIGYALFNLTTMTTIETEYFLVAFILIALVLDAALDGAVLLARREPKESTTTDGGTER